MIAPSAGYAEAFFAGLFPRTRMTASEWADRYRVIPDGTSVADGQWKTSRTPYVREPLDAISDPSVEQVVCMWASQLGKTDGILLNAIGYFAAQDPSPILLVEPTEDMATAFSKERLGPTFRASPALQGKISESKRDSSNTIFHKQFPGGYLAMAWATSAVSLASRPIRILLGDEVDKWADSIGRDGDPWPQAVQRAATFYNRKIIAVSTPDISGRSRIEKLFLDSDQRRLWVPCPHCGADQVLRWEGVRYKNAEGEHDLEHVYYRCEHCEGRILEHHKIEMLAACRWVPENPGHPTRGYQLSALYSPFVKWRELAAKWIKVTQDRDRRGLQEFVNLCLGEPWDEGGGEVHAEDLEKNREDYEADVPPGALLLTAGVDVQDNRLEVEILGWGLGRESCGVHYAILPGDTSTPGPWAALDQLLQRQWLRPGGRGVSLGCVCIDSGGHRTDEVYAFCRARVARNVFPVKGRAGVGHPIAGKPTLNKLQAPLYHVGVDTAKEAIMSRLALPDPGPGYCHFPREAAHGYDGEYFRGLVSEKRRMKKRGDGRMAPIWVQTYKRNEPLDCRNYATAAMEILLITTPDLFSQLAEREAAWAKGTPPTPPRPPPGRRVLSRGIE